MEPEIAKIKEDVAELKTRMAVAESSIKDIKEDLSSIKSNTTWIIRLIVGAMILAIVGFAMQGGFK
jgi:hypothetical protein